MHKMLQLSAQYGLIDTPEMRVAIRALALPSDHTIQILNCLPAVQYRLSQGETIAWDAVGYQDILIGLQPTDTVLTPEQRASLITEAFTVVLAAWETRKRILLDEANMAMAELYELGQQLIGEQNPS